jgi:thioesterase domain-containing protein
MTPSEVESYLHGHIPLTAQMGVRVTACDESGATLTAPLAPNVNHRATVFGGSASALAILAAWTWLHHAMRTAGPVRLVIQRNTVDYVAPITGDFAARCDAPSAADFAKFDRIFRRHGKARIELTATLTCEGAHVVNFVGEYVAVKLD